MTDNKNNVAAAKSGGRKLKNDIILIAALLIAVSLVGVCVYLFRSEGDRVEVRVGGEIYGTYPMNEDITVEIRTGEQNERINVLVIKDGKAYVSEANCPTQSWLKCTNHRAICYNGESIICQAHEIVITVYSADQADGPDIVA